MIDCHTHFITVWEKDEFNIEMLVRHMDELEIEKFCVLPSTSPENPYFINTTEDVLAAYKKFPDRIIPFCDVDPRKGKNHPSTDFTWILKHYKDLGCRGLGEMTANLYFDDPLCKNLYYHCGKAGLPITFHLYTRFGGSYGLIDGLHMPRLEKCLQEFPETVFLGHAMAFWSEISADVTDQTRGGYPKGKVTAPGKLAELLKKYPNLYGDISAGSGFNAITRDMDYCYKFLTEFQDKLVFGTDICHPVQDCPIVCFFRNALKNGKITKTVYDKITEDNIKRVLAI
ncbi:MAG: amidohydrolase family protein [Elusimicrobiota bacterium]